MSDITQQKQHLRQQLFKARQSLSAQQRKAYSSRIQTFALQYLQHQEAQQLLAYKALAEEVNTDELLATQNMEVFVPQMLSGTEMQWLKIDAQTQWAQVSFGVYEPVAGDVWQPGDASAVLFCPLLGFDREGHRLGMGKGYFDRWLQQHGENLDVVGLAFSCQELPKVPVEPHDVPLATIITEQGIRHVR